MDRPKVGIALGAGGARGLAHIGVLKVFEEENIPIDYIAGSSIGSLIGVLYANGTDLAMIEELSTQIKRNQMIDLTIPKKGLIVGNKVQELIRLLTHRKNLEDLKIPTAVVATDLVTGERVVFREGPIDIAVRASISIPGVFEPVYLGEQILVDGGVVDRIPISVIKEMGADITIGVNVVPPFGKTRIENIFDVITQSIIIMEREIMSQHIPIADCLIHPDLCEISPTDFSNVRECVQQGEETTRREIKKIKELIENYEGQRNEPS